MLPGHNTDHRAIVAILHTGKKGNIEAYRRKLQQCPLKIPRGRMSSDEKKFETLRRAVEPQQARDRPENSWIRPGTWALIHSRAGMRSDGRLTRALSRRYARKIRASLKQDRIERARRVGEAISGHLAAGDYKEAWRSLRGWHRMAGNAPQKRCHAAMEQQTKEREALYAAVDPPGLPIPCNVERVDVEDGAPSDALLREVVTKLKNDRAKGAC